MGSSHMEAFQVRVEKNTASKLNSMLKEQVYNIGISGHNFLTCASNLKSAVQKYKPKEYIIIETDRITFLNNDLENVLNGEIPEIQSHTSGIIGLLQKNQFLRVLYEKLKDFINKDNDTDIEDLENNVNNEETKMDEKLLNKIFEKMNEDIKQAVSSKIIVVYHPSIELNYNGSISLLHKKEDVQIFEELCKKNNIYFLDMSNRFEYEYVNNHKLPYGFSNSTIGTGHLNEDGHFMIADELYKLIMEVK